MSRERRLHPEILDSDDYQTLSFAARCLFVGLIVKADDHGRGKAGAEVLLGTIFPHDGLTRDDLEALKLELACRQRRMVHFYRSGPSLLYQIVKWAKYQKPRWCKESKLEPYSEGADIYPGEMGETPSGEVTAAGPPQDRRRPRDITAAGPADKVGMGREGKGRVGMGERAAGKRHPEDAPGPALPLSGSNGSPEPDPEPEQTTEDEHDPSFRSANRVAPRSPDPRLDLGSSQRETTDPSDFRTTARQAAAVMRSTLKIAPAPKPEPAPEPKPKPPTPPKSRAGLRRMFETRKDRGGGFKALDGGKPGKSGDGGDAA